MRTAAAEETPDNLLHLDGQRREPPTQTGGVWSERPDRAGFLISLSGMLLVFAGIVLILLGVMVKRRAA
jgi:hypothetical protein